eukprot:IDg8528t1
MKNYRLKAEKIQKRDGYVQFMTAENQDPTRRVAYMEKRYIHKKYQRHDYSLFDPNDEQELEVKEMHKSKRHSFVAVIIDEYQTLANVQEEQKPKVSKTHLILETIDVFKGGKKQTVDYYGMFDTKHFVGWMKKFLDALLGVGIQYSVIVMENTK